MSMRIHFETESLGPGQVQWYRDLEAAVISILSQS